MVIQQRKVESGKVETKEFNIVMGAAPVAHGAAGERTESFGRRTVEGVGADGTRSILVIPAGQIGNERPIEIVTGRWRSPELQVTVMSRRIDPRFGETNDRLTNIQKGEPLRALFEIPPDYRIEDPPTQIKLMRRDKK